MAKFELIMPKMGESIMEATILKWVKQPGDRVELDETIHERIVPSSVIMV